MDPFQHGLGNPHFADAALLIARRVEHHEQAIAIYESIDNAPAYEKFTRATTQM